MTNASLTDMQAMVPIPLALSSADLSTNPGRCFWEQVGVNAPGTAKRIDFLPDVRADTGVVCSSSEASK
uniref:Uncharacterized protein MANES_09G059900 n=1 Tax=Rhizophora mucronata TaxID=61149 RepID=A0A2P2MAK4_RHIMU